MSHTSREPNPAWVQSHGWCGRRQIEAEIDLVEIRRHPALADLAAQSLKAPQEEEGRGGCCGGGGGGGGYPNPLMHQVGVLVRRQWTLDMRDFGYKFTWVWLYPLRVCLAPFLEGVGPRIGISSQVLNGFVLALNASTYLLVAQARSPSVRWALRSEMPRRLPPVSRCGAARSRKCLGSVPVWRREGRLALAPPHSLCVCVCVWRSVPPLPSPRRAAAARRAARLRLPRRHGLLGEPR